MSKNGRIVLTVLFGIMILGILAFLTLVGIYTVKIRRGQPISGITDRFTKTAKTARSVKISPDLTAKIADAQGDPAFGTPGAPITIIEFADAQCPYSAEFSRTLRKAMLKFPDKFHFVFRDFPLTDIHDNAVAGAIALSCAHAQGKFWQMHDKVFANQEKLSPQDLVAYGQQTGLDMAKFNTCLTDPAIQKEVNDDTAVGIEAGVSGTPTFFINGHKVEGAIPETLFEKLLLNAK